MANPTTYPMKSAERTVVALFLDVTIGATGAVSSINWSNELGQGSTAAVVRTGVGAYTITFREGWERIVGFVAPEVWGASHVATEGLQSQVLTIANTAAPPVMTIAFFTEDASSAAADIHSGNHFSMVIFAQASKP